MSINRVDHGAALDELMTDILASLMHKGVRTHHGINHVLVRGLAKVTCVALLAAITSNLLQHAATLLG